MATISIRVTASGLARQLGIQLSRIADMSKAMRACADFAHAQVAREFLGRVWFAPSGGSVPWAATHAFGSRPASSSPLVSSGAYLAALSGRGAGAIDVVGPRSFKIGADGATFPYAKFHRGGTGGAIRTAPWVIRPVKRTAQASTARGRRDTLRGRTSYVRQWSMFWKVGLTFGAWLSEKTLREGLRLPPRPHLTKHPALVQRCGEICRAFIARGEVPA